MKFYRSTATFVCPGARSVFAVVAALALLLSACASPAPATQAPAETEASAETEAPVQPYAGETITLQTYSGMGQFDFYKTLMPDFEAKTGIKVNYIQLPVAGMDQKVPLQLTAKDESLDVFFTGSENIGSYIGINGVEPLDAYINDPAQTPASWNYADFAPDVQAACQNGGKTWCIASHTGGAMLYYNKKMFAEAGITEMPKNPQELLETAKKLTTPEHAGFCVRGDKTQNLYTAFQLWQWFYRYDNDVTGNYFDRDWNFLIGQNPNASEFGSWYRELLQTTAPAGIATYLVTNCMQDFQQGRVAMWHDDSSMIPDVLNPEKSRVSEDTAFYVLPCQDVNPNHCSLVQPFGTWMNAASKHKGAAWQLIQYLTSKEVQAKAAKAGALLTPSRLSVLKDPEVIAAMPETFPEALTSVLEHPNVVLLPFIPEGVAILPPMLNGLSELIATDKPVDQVMADMTTGVNDIMEKAGYPKPFPEP